MRGERGGEEGCRLSSPVARRNSSFRLVGRGTNFIFVVKALFLELKSKTRVEETDMGGRKSCDET